MPHPTAAPERLTFVTFHTGLSLAGSSAGMVGEVDVKRCTSTNSPLANSGRMQRSGSRVQGVSCDMSHSSGVSAR